MVGKIAAFVVVYGAILAIALVICFGIGSLTWPYTINTWLIYAGKEPVLEWWMGGFIGLVPGFGQLSIPAAIVTFILMLFLGAAVV